MRKNLLIVVIAVLSFVGVGVAYAIPPYVLVFPQQITISSTSPPPNGAITIAFDDNEASQYQNAWPLMKERGMVGTFYVDTISIRDISGESFYMSSAELLDLQNHGCEIASHSHTHPDFTTLSESQVREECITSKEILESYGLRINNFAYPYGASNPEIDLIVDDYYRSGRYDWGIMRFPVSTFQVLGWSSYDDVDDFTPLKQVVDAVYETKGWTIIYFHDVKPNESGGGTTSTEDFEKFLNYVIQKDVAVITVNQGLDGDQDALEIKVYSDSELSNELPNGTLVDWGQGQKGENYKPFWIQNVGTVPVELNFILDTLPASWDLTWDYKGQVIDTGVTLKVFFTLTVSQDTEDGTHGFGPLQITAFEA